MTDGFCFRVESNSGKREAKGERYRIHNKRKCLDRVCVSCEVFLDFSSISEMESVGDSFGLSVCVPAVLPSMLVVTLRFSNVNVVCEVVFSDSDCGYVEPQTISSENSKGVY